MNYITSMDHLRPRTYLCGGTVIGQSGQDFEIASLPIESPMSSWKLNRLRVGRPRDARGGERWAGHSHTCSGVDNRNSVSLAGCWRKLFDTGAKHRVGCRGLRRGVWGAGWTWGLDLHLEGGRVWRTTSRGRPVRVCDIDIIHLIFTQKSRAEFEVVVQIEGSCRLIPIPRRRHRRHIVWWGTLKWERKGHDLVCWCDKQWEEVFFETTCGGEFIDI